jgi:nitroimidazol reductase NimA-like FMN-containing flavoprotein (pyridoxamine 5'-phosphate oxidase superfamily)
MADVFELTDRTAVKRLPDRGSYARADAYAILDEAIVCHLGFTDEAGSPVVIPTAFARDGDLLYVHGSPASRTLRALDGGVPVCVTVTLVDGLVLAKSAFHHSINYRSVVVFGTARAVTDPAAKRAALDNFVDHIVPGRTGDTRPPTEQELKGTLVLAVPLDEASVKTRTGGPIDDEEDVDLPVWAGVVDVRSEFAAPADAPAYVRDYARPSRAS